MPTAIPKLNTLFSSIAPPRESCSQKSTDFDDALQTAQAKSAPAEKTQDTNPAQKKPAAALKKADKSVPKGKVSKKSDPAPEETDDATEPQDADPAQLSDQPVDAGGPQQAPKTPTPAKSQSPLDPSLTALTPPTTQPELRPQPQNKTDASEDAASDTSTDAPITSLQNAIQQTSPQVSAPQSTHAANQTKPHLADALGDQSAPTDTASTAANKHAANASQNPEQDQISSALKELIAQLTDPTPDQKTTTTVTDPTDPLTATLNAISPTTPHTQSAPQVAQTPAPPPPTDAQFADQNHLKIVSDIKTHLLPHGGSMQIRLDPPELGALQVKIELHQGVITASFETNNDNATRLLGHSLDQLRQSLESQGITVDKLQVRQSPKDESAQHNPQDPNQQNSPTQDSDARHEQQRKDLLNRMWRRLSTGDPLDLVA